MAIVDRVHGNSGGVVNVDNVVGSDSISSSSVGSIISTGIGKHPFAVKITTPGDLTNQMEVGGAVEIMLRQIEIASTVLAYQVDGNAIVLNGNTMTTGSQLSVLLESYGFGNDYNIEAASSLSAAQALVAAQAAAVSPAIVITPASTIPALQAQSSDIALQAQLYSLGTAFVSPDAAPELNGTADPGLLVAFNFQTCTVSSTEGMRFF